jgi:hypothetical protein
VLERYKAIYEEGKVLNFSQADREYFLIGMMKVNFLNRLESSVCQGKEKPYSKLCELFDEQTQNGEEMCQYSDLLEKAIAAIASQFARKSADNLFSGCGGKLTDSANQIKHSNDFELITWLVIKNKTGMDDK